MPFETLEDIIRALEQHPEWREPLLRALGLDGLLALPNQVAALRQESEQRFTRLEGMLAQLIDIARETLEIQRGTLEMVRVLIQDVSQMAERQNQFEALMRQMAERQDRLEALMQQMAERQDRFEALLQQVIERQNQFEVLMQQFAAQLLQLTERVSRLEERYEDLSIKYGELADKYSKLADDVGSLKGIVLELKYRERAAAIFGRYLRKMRLVPIDELLETLEAVKPLSEEELDELLLADAIFTAVRATTREPLYLVLEVSYVVDRGDVDRAIRRARILKERGFKAVPAVGGEQATEGAKLSAEKGEILLALDGAIRGAAALN